MGDAGGSFQGEPSGKFRLMKRIGMAALLFLVTACASPQAALVHLKSGDIQTCVSSGWGWLGAPMALNEFGNCIERWESLGYIQAEKLTPEQRATLRPTPRPFEADIKIKNR